MPAKAIATKKMKIEVQPPVKGQVTVKSQPSTDVKVGGNGVYCGPLKFSVSEIVNETDTCGTALAGTLSEGVIEPTANDTKVGGKPVIREGDKVENLKSVDAKKPVPGSSPVVCTITFTVKITDAGQSDVKGS